MTEIVEIVKKYGVNGILCVCLWWMNNRLTAVEQKLYDCYKDQVIINRNSSENYNAQKRLIAILPNEKNNTRHARTQRKV